METLCSKDHVITIEVMEELELYLIKFDKTSYMILKIYFSNYEVEGDKY